MITSGEVEVRWVPRGGGAMVHTPGQLAIYPIVPLELLGISIGDYLARLLGVLLEVLDVMKVKAYTSDDQTSIVGRTGTLAHIGIGIRNGITWHGAFLNVSPCLGLKNLLHQPDKSKELRETSLVAERQKGVTMPQVRSLVLERLATALGYAEHHPVSRV